jgi:GNAT superfamily N-acetyltransferase
VPEPTIRAYRPGDRAALYRICLRTGDRGRDASATYADPWLLGHVYLGPYLAFDPHLAFVADDGTGAPVGYALGTADTAAFEATCERRWWPALRGRYPDPVAVAPAHRTADQRLAHHLHYPPRAPAALLARYPAHLHIDLLPVAQRRGLGRRLLGRLLAALAAAGAAGVHLGVAAGNEPAIAFYRRLGFTELSPLTFIRDLPAAGPDRPAATPPDGAGS